MSFNKIFIIIVNFLPSWSFFSILWGLGTEHSGEEMKVKNFEEKNLKEKNVYYELSRCIEFKLDSTAPESEKCVLCPLYHTNNEM